MASNNLYIADTGNNDVREITPAGAITTIASQLNNPVSVAMIGDTQGSVYIADSGNNRIVQVTAAGTASTFAKIIGPLAVAVDASGNCLCRRCQPNLEGRVRWHSQFADQRTYFARRHGLRIGRHADDRGHGRQCHSPAQHHQAC